MLLESTVDIIKAITPAVGENADAITCNFYQRMFAGNPEVKAYFNQAHQHSGQQPKALAGAVCAYFSNIDNLEALGPAVELIAQKHCSLGVLPEHYPIVGKHLLDAIADVMGEAVTPEIADAVAEAYNLLARVCIDREDQIYQQQTAADGGWKGYRDFEVVQKVSECDIITSFHLKPVDGGTLPKFHAGQFITVKVDHPTTPTSPRNYSLSTSNGRDYLRISVKKEAGDEPDGTAGLISNFLHDEVAVGSTLKIGPPCGNFILDPEDLTHTRPIVFIAGGVGATPLLAMAQTLVDYAVLNPVYFLHSMKNSAAHPFADEVQMMVSDKDFTNTLSLYSDPLPGDVEGFRCDRVGRVTTELLKEWTPYGQADFYFCGPKPFMKSVLASLRQLGVDDARINFEFFGPREEIEAEATA